MSGYAEEALVGQPAGAGANALIEKPFAVWLRSHRRRAPARRSSPDPARPR